MNLVAQKDQKLSAPIDLFQSFMVDFMTKMIKIMTFSIKSHCDAYCWFHRYYAGLCCIKFQASVPRPVGGENISGILIPTFNTIELKVNLR